MCQGRATTERLELEACSVDLHERVVRRDGGEVGLTELEARLLGYLADRPGQAVARTELQDSVWGYAHTVQTRAMDSAVKRLRKKIERDPKAPRHLHTAFGVGYRFEPGRSRAVGAEVPAASTSFLGREQELGALVRHLDHARLVTVVGPGGAGKTRLVLELARNHGDVGELTLCELAAVTSGLDLVLSVGEALGVRVDARASAAEAASELGVALAARRRPVLLLDNLEQVAEAAAQAIGTWLQMCPEARFVATSRHRLGLGGEQVLELPPLETSVAATLFADRASRVDAAPPPDAEDPAVADIVSRLGGLPLAIELAAARMGLLSLHELGLRLRRSLDVLSARGRDFPDRHATLRGTLDWSWDLLDEEEQAALSACGAFRGGFTVEAAEAVIGGDNALDVLERLRHRSWLVVTAGRTGRLALPPLLQAYVAERLASSGDREVVWRRHAEWTLDRAEARVLGRVRGWSVIREVADDLGNLFAVYERTVDRDRESHARAVTLLAAVLPFIGPLDRRPQLIETGAAAVDEVSAPRAVQLLLALGGLLHGTGRREEGDAALAQAMGLALERGTGAECAEARLFQAWWTLRAGRAEQALAWFVDAEARAIDAGVRWVEADAAFGIGAIALEGDGEGGEPHLQRSLEAARAARDPTAQLRVLHGLAVATLDAGRLAEADAYLERAQALLDADGADAVRGLRAVVYLERADLQGAVREVEAMRRWADRYGSRAHRAQARSVRGMVALVEGDWARALEHFDDALAVWGPRGVELYIIAARALAALASALGGNLVRAERELVFVRDWNDRIGLPAYTAWFRACEAGVRLVAGEDVGEALAEARTWGARSHRVRLVVRLLDWRVSAQGSGR